mmetsp:Transcript_3560/g.9226  ORF Transcript_3560/g.9226 Transcript_3560/m.9226 type:complete len:257 (-) Transcript_3560:62-832(-)
MVARRQRVRPLWLPACAARRIRRPRARGKGAGGSVPAPQSDGERVDAPDGRGRGGRACVRHAAPGRAAAWRAAPRGGHARLDCVRGLPAWCLLLPRLLGELPPLLRHGGARAAHADQGGLRRRAHARVGLVAAGAPVRTQLRRARLAPDVRHRHLGPRGDRRRALPAPALRHAGVPARACGRLPRDRLVRRDARHPADGVGAHAAHRHRRDRDGRALLGRRDHRRLALPGAACRAYRGRAEHGDLECGRRGARRRR